MTDRPFDRVPWKDLPDWYRDLVVETLHPESRQLTAYQLRQGGMKQRDISRTMDLALSTVQTMLARADQRIDIALRANPHDEAAA